MNSHPVVKGLDTLPAGGDVEVTVTSQAVTEAPSAGVPAYSPLPRRVILNPVAAISLYIYLNF